MKIAVSASGKDLDAPINQRFGRCDYFLIIDSDTMETQSFPNENGAQSSGAGIQAASFVISKGAKAVLTGNCGPKAMDVFAAENIAVYTGQAGTVRQAVEAFKNNRLAASPPSKEDAPPPGANQGPRIPPTGRGMGGGGGMGGGRGMGKGGGRGGGRGMGGGGGQGMGGGRGLGGGCRKNR
ncbi:MAG: NifB/NifX family molybdenum-iron cluster-binding protein [Desulfotignum sp.]|jgi:predicted Fe-Mo cluster-binding NifX family protein|nr:NifB/NifX family molybdenum-iron cluster-binding protein [Desulfotignum sp.]